MKAGLVSHFIWYRFSLYTFKFKYIFLCHIARLKICCRLETIVYDTNTSQDTVEEFIWIGKLQRLSAGQFSCEHGINNVITWYSYKWASLWKNSSLHRQIRDNTFHSYGMFPFLPKFKFRRKVLSLISLCGMHRLIWENTLHTCIFPEQGSNWILL